MNKRKRKNLFAAPYDDAINDKIHGDEINDLSYMSVLQNQKTDHIIFSEVSSNLGLSPSRIEINDECSQLESSRNIGINVSSTPPSDCFELLQPYVTESTFSHSYHDGILHCPPSGIHQKLNDDRLYNQPHSNTRQFQHCRARVGHIVQPHLLQSGVSSYYIDLGDCIHVCEHCGASFWYAERLKRASTTAHPKFSKCCLGNRVVLPHPREPPDTVRQLYCDDHFMANIRAYNMMFAMTSFGARIDEAINNGRGPYVFRVEGQISHWIGSLCPPPDSDPRFLQMYVYDTDNEIVNRLRCFEQRDDSQLKPEIVEALIKILDENNDLVKLFRTARDKCVDAQIHDFRIRLHNSRSQKQYDAPVQGSIGAIVYDTGPKAKNDYDIIIESTYGRPQRINKLHPCYMALQFPLLFIFGEHGYSVDMKLADSRAVDKRLTMRMFYIYQLHDRYNLYALLPRGGRLFQQYVVNAYIAVEQNRLDWILSKQADLRNEYFQGIHDALLRGDSDGHDEGKRTILPASFTGSPRYMYRHYQDALAICRVHGNPQFFITFTCNVKWPEIRRYLENFPEMKAEDRADIICRVFQLKVQEYVKYLKDKKPFGEVAAVLYTIEFQKRGLPHFHSLLWLTPSSKIHMPEQVDSFISAEIPDDKTDPATFKVVTDLMMHGPCGLAKPTASCMVDNACSKNFPKKYEPTTFFDKDGYAHYRRRSNEMSMLKNGVQLDNSYVVPYNRSLLLVFHAHINVEFCGWTMMIKYLFKYISKGADRIRAKITNDIGEPDPATQNQKKEVNEIQNYLDCRYIFPHEAFWRIFEFDIHKREPPVQILAIHLESMQQVSFRHGELLQSVVSNPMNSRTTLTQWLNNNAFDSTGHHLTYLNYPSEYVWYSQSRSWSRRVTKHVAAIGRWIYLHPSCGELFYMRMLLLHQRGCKTFQEIRTVNNVTFTTYRAACEALGLLGDDKEWDTTFEEATIWATAQQLRSLFAHMLQLCEISNPIALWQKHWKKMADDIPVQIRSTHYIRNLHLDDGYLRNYVLYQLEALLNEASKSLVDFDLPMPPPELLLELSNKILMEEKSYDRAIMSVDDERLLSGLNVDQRIIYDVIMQASLSNQQELIFVHGHGGTGKTFLWKTIIFGLRAIGHIVLAVASSGIASLLLPSGRTTHSRFKVPLDITDDSICHIKKGTQLARLLIETKLIIWDEAPMNDRRCFEALDKSLRDILNQPDSPFGGKSVILGGDFRQTLPVKPQGTKADIIACSIARSFLWRYFKVYRLTKNMTLMQPNLTADAISLIADFSSWLVRIGDGSVGVPDEVDPLDTKWIQIPAQFLIEDHEHAINELINFIYNQDTLQNPTARDLCDKAIVCPKNETADWINDQVLALLPVEGVTYSSFDEAVPLANERGDTEVLY